MKNRFVGQFLRGFTRFVQKWGACPYKLEKNWRRFLESGDNRRNFVFEKREQAAPQQLRVNSIAFGLHCPCSRFKIPFLLQIVWLIYG